MDFEERLMNLIDAWVAVGGDMDEVISALELRLMALKEEQMTELRAEVSYRKLVAEALVKRSEGGKP